MADPIKLDPLGVYGDVVVIDASPLLHERPTSITRLPPKAARPVALKPLDAGPPALLSRDTQLELARKTGKLALPELDPVKQTKVPVLKDLRLSPRQPWVSGRGHIDFFGARVLGPESDLASFQSDDPGSQHVEIWLKGLQTGASYLAQIRLSGLPGGHFRVRGSDTGPEILFTAGYQRTVVAALQTVKSPLSLLIVDAVNSSDWLFYDITVTAL